MGVIPGAPAPLYCPEATESTGIELVTGNAGYGYGGWCRGTARHKWAWKLTPHSDDLDYFVNGGSYGWNHWTLTIPPLPPDDVRRRDRQYFFGACPADTSRIPLMGDCVDLEAWPKDGELPPTNLFAPVPLHWPEAFEADNLGVRKFCMARHGRAVNLLFLDGHAATTHLEELWQLKWSAIFEPRIVRLPPQ
jgi:prepilin-type processing-associated H-X9-DG protein